MHDNLLESKKKLKKKHTRYQARCRALYQNQLLEAIVTRRYRINPISDRDAAAPDPQDLLCVCVISNFLALHEAFHELMVTESAAYCLWFLLDIYFFKSCVRSISLYALGYSSR